MDGINFMDNLKESGLRLLPLSTVSTTIGRMYILLSEQT